MFVVTPCLLALALLSSPQMTAAAPGSPLSPRIRALDPAAVRLLTDGPRRSPTIRSLIDQLAGRDVIIMVVTSTTLSRPGQLTFLGANAGTRYVTISIRLPALLDDPLVWFGHELRHAVEIAGAASVVDQATLGSFYEAVGTGHASFGRFETDEAQHVVGRVRNELQDAPPAAPERFR
jgi:hypothetical protein